MLFIEVKNVQSFYLKQQSQLKPYSLHKPHSSNIETLAQAQ